MYIYLYRATRSFFNPYDCWFVSWSDRIFAEFLIAYLRVSLSLISALFRLATRRLTRLIYPFIFYFLPLFSLWRLWRGRERASFVHVFLCRSQRAGIARERIFVFIGHTRVRAAATRRRATERLPQIPALGDFFLSSCAVRSLYIFFCSTRSHSAKKQCWLIKLDYVESNEN